jgi:hypothetical protein
MPDAPPVTTTPRSAISFGICFFLGKPDARHRPGS